MQDTYRALPNTGINLIACYGNLDNDMLNIFRQMLAKQKPSLSKKAQKFVTKLSVTDIWVLAIGVRGTPALPNIADPEEYFKEASKVVVAHRKPLSELGDDDSLFAFNYKWESRRILPFFSSEEPARIVCVLDLSLCHNITNMNCCLTHVLPLSAKLKTMRGCCCVHSLPLPNILSYRKCPAPIGPAASLS